MKSESRFFLCTMDAVSLTFAAVIIVLISLWYSQKSNVKNPLPGPTGFPVVGYFPFMMKKPYKVLQKLAHKYGPVYKVRLGGRDIVVLCDFKSIKEAFTDDAFMGRPPDTFLEFAEATKRTGALFDLPYKEQRRFTLHTFRDLGFGKTKMEKHIKEEILEVLEILQQLKEKTVKMSDILTPSTSNNITSLMFGRRMKYNDPRRKRLDQLVSEVSLNAGNTSWAFFFPYVTAFMKFFNIGVNVRVNNAIRGVKEYCRKELKEHEATLDPNNIRDYMDRYLLEIEKKKGDINSSFKKDVLVDMSSAFFLAGSDTVSITSVWMLLVAAAFPEIQKKIHHEIDDVLGRDRFPTWQDRLDMPYTEAAILEVMRWKTIIPLNILRYTLKDTELNGYFVPKHTYVFAVLYAPDHDETLWGKDVDEYKPERFLSEDRKKVLKPEYFIPFSIGKRSCPGKPLAEIEIFLYCVAILQKFKLSMPPGQKADFEEVFGVGLQPKKQDICYELR